MLTRINHSTTTGQTIYGILHNGDTGQFWNGSIWAGIDTIAYASLAVPFAEMAASDGVFGDYTVDISAALAAIGSNLLPPTSVDVVIHRRVGGTAVKTDPVISQLTHVPVAGGSGSSGTVDTTAVTTALTAAMTAALAVLKAEIFAKLESISITPRAAPAAGGVGIVGDPQIARKIHIEHDGEPVPGATVWVTSDVGGNTLMAGSVITDSNGRTPDMWFLPDAVIYIWAQHNTLQLDNPRRMVWA